MQARGWGPLVLAPGPRRRRTDPTHRYARSRAPPYNPTPHSAGSSFYTYTDTGGRVYNTDTHRRSKKTREREEYESGQRAKEESEPRSQPTVRARVASRPEVRAYTWIYIRAAVLSRTLFRYSRPRARLYIPSCLVVGVSRLLLLASCWCTRIIPAREWWRVRAVAARSGSSWL